MANNINNMAEIMNNNSEETHNNEIRTDMKAYWNSHSKKASVQEMMLDDNAEMLGKEEIPEIMGLLPTIKGKNVVELGAGIGRFTGLLASKAHKLTAVDFMQKFINKNQEINGHYNNVTFLCEDVTKMQLPENSVDVIFSNWLFMYLSNKEVVSVFRKMLSWLRKDGCIFFRESCFKQSGDKQRDFNPTKYREPELYRQLVTSAYQPGFGYSLVRQKSVSTYIKYKDNHFQVCWLFKKTKMATHDAKGFSTFQEFLDNSQYTQNGILRYEKIFGRNFVSTGGKETTEEFLPMLDLKPDQYALDVGCGIGGSAFMMAEKYGARVLGLDLSSNMIDIALVRTKEALNASSKVEFEVADATLQHYAKSTYDVVYSRDTILHIKDKRSLFSNFLDWLKPGGKLLITDYCCGPPEHSEAFEAYVAQRGYHLLTTQQYGKLLEDVGFVKVRAEDRTKQFSQILINERTRTEARKEEFIKEFSQIDYDNIIGGWTNKLERVRGGEGDQRWGLFYAEKPL